MSVRSKKKEASFDVIVVGGGMTGMCAAIASARHGAKTALVQERPVFGGNASSEIRVGACGATANHIKPDLEETGIFQEITHGDFIFFQSFSTSLLLPDDIY